MMSGPAYHLVFDLAQTTLPPGWKFIATGSLFVFLGALMVFWPGLMDRFRFGRLQGSARRVFAWVFFLFAVTWTITVTWHMLTIDARLRTASKTNSCTIVEGVVTDYVPMPEGGHADEKFSVNGVKFAYSDYEVTGGFNNAASHGGPRLSGRQVRICYVPRAGASTNVIVRLEVAQ